MLNFIILHAWNEINGKIIDITIINKFGEYTLGIFEDDIEYFGCAFPTDYVKNTFLHKTRSRSLLMDISDDKNPWPLLRKKFTDEYLQSITKNLSI